MKPETVLRWHREGFKRYWTWKSRVRRGGRPKVDPEVRELSRRMNRANPTWGAPRIHGELLKLGIVVSPATVSKYMVRRRKPPSQTWFWWFWVNVATTAKSIRFHDPRAAPGMWFVVYPFPVLQGLAYLVWSLIYFEHIYGVRPFG